MISVINELRKMKIGRVYIAMLIFFVFGNIFISFLYHDNSFQSHEALENERNMYVETLASIENEDEYNLKNICEEKIAIINYCIDNNIPYQQLSVPGNLAKNAVAENLAILFIVLLINNLVSVEYHNDTWKNIFLLTNRNGKIVLLKKKITELAIIIGVIVSFLGVAVVFGVIVYRDWTNITIDYVNGAIMTSTYTHEIINMVVSLLVRAFIYGGISFITAVICKEKTVTVIIITVLVLFEKPIYEFLKILKFSYLLPFDYMHILENVCDYERSIAVKAILYVFLLLIIMNMVLVYSFNKCIVQNPKAYLFSYIINTQKNGNSGRRPD